MSNLVVFSTNEVHGTKWHLNYAAHLSTSKVPNLFLLVTQF